MHNNVEIHGVVGVHPCKDVGDYNIIVTKVSTNTNHACS